MGRSNRFADMNEVYTDTKIIRKKQLAIRLLYMSSGPNGCRRQPRPRLTEAEGKSNTEPWIRGINFGHWRINLKPRLPEYSTHVVTMRMDPETLLRSAESMDISTMRKLMPLGGWTSSNLIHQNSKVACNPKSSWWQKKIKKIPQKEVPRKIGKIVPKEGAEIKHQLVSRYVGSTCRQFRHTCILGGKVAKLVIDPMSGVNIVSEDAVRKLGLDTQRHRNPYQLEWLTK